MVSQVLNELILLMVFLLVGFALRELIPPLRKIHLPASIIGGVIALILGPQVLGLITIPETWSGYASPMVNVVITCMMFGIVIDSKRLKGFAPVIVLPFVIYSMQVLVGTLTGFGLSKIWSNLYEGWGLMNVFAFYGGHGGAITAGGAFESVGVPDMGTMGIVLSTIGLVVGMIVGMILVNMGIRKGWAKYVHQEIKGANIAGPIPKEKQVPVGMETVPNSGISNLALQLSLIFLSMWVGGKLVQGLTKIVPAASNLPSLLNGLLGAVLIFNLMRLLKIDGYVDKKSINSLSGLALEFCVTSATATLNLKFIAANLVPILIVSVLVTLVTVFHCLVLIPRYMKKSDDWFEWAMYVFGQSTGVVATGMALYRCVDPDGQSNALENNSISSILNTPFSSTMIAFLPILLVRSFWGVMGVFAIGLVVLLLFCELVLKKQASK